MCQGQCFEYSSFVELNEKKIGKMCLVFKTILKSYHRTNNEIHRVTQNILSEILYICEYFFFNFLFN